MEYKDIEKIINGVSSSLTERIKEEVYEQTKEKDEEISTLHREINGHMEKQTGLMLTMQTTLNSHDKVIQEIMYIYNTGNFIKKAFMWVILFVPVAAAFFAGLIYIQGLFKKQ